MKAVRIIPVLFLFAVASAAYVWLRPPAEIPPSTQPVALPGELQTNGQMTESATNAARGESTEPVQPLEERGDAMLFEIDALQNTPFDDAITMPFD